MTKEEMVEYAIKYFGHRLRDPVLPYGERQAINIAISALREQEERSKGCERCLGIAGELLVDDLHAKFCPMCGRRLEEV